MHSEMNYKNDIIVRKHVNEPLKDEEAVREKDIEKCNKIKISKGNKRQ